MYKTVSGSAITISVPHVYNDEALTLTNLQYTVYDASGTVITGPTDVSDFDAAGGETNVTIDGMYNNTVKKYDVRSVEFHLITDTNSIYKVTEFYEVEGDLLKLTPFVDSFMTYAESLVVSRQLSVPTPFFDVLEDDERAVTLENAYERLTALPFASLPTGTKSLLDLSTAQWQALDAKFLNALKKAQIVEANHMVEVNPVKDKIRMGIISETIGESSMFFNQKGVDTRSVYPGVSDDAYPLLSKYLFRETTNSQIWKLRRS